MIHTAGSDHCFHTVHVVRSHFHNLMKQKVKTMFATGETAGLVKWIIDDTCLVYITFEVTIICITSNVFNETLFISWKDNTIEDDFSLD